MDKLTFEEAIEYTAQLLQKYSNIIDSEDAKALSNAQSEATLEKEVTALLQTTYGPRGFFVALLTQDWPVPPQPIVNALNSCPNPSAELMVKNLVMATAMVITHQRLNAPDQAQMSQATAHRSQKLLDQWRHPSLVAIAEKMRSSIDTGEGEYADFLRKWGYDAEQKQAMKEALSNLLTAHP